MQSTRRKMSTAAQFVIATAVIAAIAGSGLVLFVVMMVMGVVRERNIEARDVKEWAPEIGTVYKVSKDYIVNGVSSEVWFDDYYKLRRAKAYSELLDSHWYITLDQGTTIRVLDVRDSRYGHIVECSCKEEDEHRRIVFTKDGWAFYLDVLELIDDT